MIYFQFSSVTQYCYLKAHNRTRQSSLQLFFFTNLFLNKILSPDIFFVSPLTFSFRSFAVPGSIISPLPSSNPLTSSLEKNGKHIVTKGVQTFWYIGFPCQTKLKKTVPCCILIRNLNITFLNDLP